jgi:hypothetical protein
MMSRGRSETFGRSRPGTSKSGMKVLTLVMSMAILVAIIVQEKIYEIR